MSQLALFPDPVRPPSGPLTLTGMASVGIRPACFYYCARLLAEGAPPDEAGRLAGLDHDQTTWVRRYVEHPSRGAHRG